MYGYNWINHILTVFIFKLLFLFLLLIFLVRHMHSCEVVANLNYFEGTFMVKLSHNTIFNFGKYKGKSLAYVYVNDKDYIYWMAENNVAEIEPDFNDEVFRSECIKEYPAYIEKIKDWDDMSEPCEPKQYRVYNDDYFHAVELINAPINNF